VAKRNKEQEEILPGFGALLEPDHEPVEEPRAPEAALPAAPVDRPRPPRTGRKVRVKTGTKGRPKPMADEEAPLPEDEPGRITKFFRSIGSRMKAYLLSIVPEDPVEKMRFKLRMLGLVKFPISFLIIGAVSILMTMFVWYLTLDYDPSFMVYSRHVSVLFLLIPFCVGIFSIIYLGINLTLLNRMERGMNERLEAMLGSEDAPAKKDDGVQEEEGDEAADGDLKGNGSPRPTA
jgi:hypothetical protein